MSNRPSHEESYARVRSFIEGQRDVCFAEEVEDAVRDLNDLASAAGMDIEDE